jgi:transposase
MNPTLEACDTFAGLTQYAGFDWGKEQHQLVVVDPQGAIVLDLRFDDSAEGWASLREKIAVFPHLGVAIETTRGPAVERLLEMNLCLYPLNPKAAQRYRDGKAPSGVKSDSLDAWSFADALGSDGHGWRILQPQDPLTQELRLLCRDEIHLIGQRTALVNQLQEALHEYYPAALQAFEDWTLPAAWQFVLRFPTPQALLKAGPRRREKFPHLHKLYRPQTAERRQEIFAKALSFASPNPAVTSAKSLLALTVAKQLQTLQEQLELYRARIEQLFSQHPDFDVFGSLPGAGAKLAPRLAAELGTNRQQFPDAQALQCYVGTAPVTQQSGKSLRTRLRWACNKYFRATVHLWADLSRHSCAWAQAYYQHKREQGKNHATALRCLGQRWLKIIWKMWQTGTRYDEALHMRNQIKHGSWVIALEPATVQA